MPLFNKFEPLPEGDLRDRLMTLAECTGFKAKTILVMDGSKRSAHSNAFFTGFGKIRRIVLYDTLMEQLKPEELEAVLMEDGKGCADTDKGCIRKRKDGWVILNNKKGGVWRKCDSRKHCEEILDAFHASKG